MQALMVEECDIGGTAVELEEQSHVAAGWNWFRRHGSPKHWVAPLVGLSEPAFRILCRRHGANMAHTEMVDPGGFARSPSYREQVLSPSPEDGPLVLQLGGSNIDMLLEAATMAVQDGRVCAVELNCGCPQRCAKKGGYGAFLLDTRSQPHLLRIITALRKVLPPEMPVLVKMRVLTDINDTAVLAQKMVAAGAGLLTVHGRTRRQGGGSHTAGDKGERLASWPHIRAVKRAVSVPVIANGNVPDRQAVQDILEFTGCDGVMSGCGLLRDPTLFSPSVTPQPIDNDGYLAEDYKWTRAVRTASEYLALAIEFHAHTTKVSKHLLWMLDGCGFKRRAPQLRKRAVQLRYGSSDPEATLASLSDDLLETVHKTATAINANQ